MAKLAIIRGMAKRAKKTVRITELKGLAALQCSHEEIASFFGISVTTFRRLLKEDEVVRCAYEEGEAEGKIGLRRKQFKLAGHNASMAIHLGKQLLGQHDKSQVELSGPNGGPVETFDYGKLTDEERQALRKTLERAVRPK